MIQPSACTPWPMAWPITKFSRCGPAGRLPGQSLLHRTKGDTFLLVYVDAHDKAYDSGEEQAIRGALR